MFLHLITASVPLTADVSSGVGDSQVMLLPKTQITYCLKLQKLSHIVNSTFLL
jgi:hypothetical protein